MRATKVHFASSDSADMYYMVQCRIPDPFFVIDSGREKKVFLNVLEIDAFRERNTNDTFEVIPVEPLMKKAKAIDGKGSRAAKLAYVIFEQYDLLKKEITVPREFPLDVADYLRSKGAVLNVSHPFIHERATKTAEEIELLRENLKKTTKGFELVEKILRAAKIKDDSLFHDGKELTSEYIKDEVEKSLFLEGMEDVEGMILSSGKQSAMPHHKGEGSIKPNTAIICDIFFRDRKNRYFGDMTRTYVKGTPTEKVRQMHETVKNSQDAAFAAIRPGALAKHVFEASAKAIRDAGFDVGDKGYIHSLGHGLGLELHEAPNAGPNSEDVLEVGNVITIEPGLYYPEWGGVRIEDVIVVGEHGVENLTNYHREYLIT
ncbi:MAG: Uncharacterized protein G01um10148_525 [Parcubacteria group bacterium Gr01-1014_8]|nr:MAG: Uncharacterized protein G01um10148_525 [Parcubacteria group bacterium Gr01-1014_8]